MRSEPLHRPDRAVEPGACNTHVGADMTAAELLAVIDEKACLDFLRLLGEAAYPARKL